MAGIISISSDEEEPSSFVEKPAKKLKTESIICLDLEDDDEDKEIKSDETGDITIESDEEKLGSEKDVTTKIIDTTDDSDKDLPNKNFHDKNNGNCTYKSLKRKRVDPNATHENTESTVNNHLEDIEESDEDTELITETIPSITLSNKSEINNIDDTIYNDRPSTSGYNDRPSTSGYNDRPSTSTQDVSEIFKNCEKMQLFINVCLAEITNEHTKDLFNSKVPLCAKLFDKVNDEYIQSETFKNFLESKIIESRQGSWKAVSSFNDVYCHLKLKLREQESDAEITNKHQRIIAKLEHALKKVHKRISELEEEEVDFDDDNDSSYIKMQRYRERAVKLHKKICKFKKEDANANCILYNRLDFSGSSIPEFNSAINRKFKNNTVFPTYYEVERCLRKTMNDKNINLSDGTFQQEARECFKNLGNLLQKRRKMDLLSIHSHYLVTNDDPAYQDEVLHAKLTTNLNEANTKIDEICQKYVRLQESGENPELSSDSDDSKRASTDDEDDCN